MVVGAGAAGRSIVDALGRAGVVEIAIVNRTPAAAIAAARLADVARVGTVADLADATLLVNATSVGMGGGGSPVDGALLRPDLAVADIVYHPLETPLLAATRSVGAQTIDGLGMLVHQGARAFELWTGMAAPVEVMLEAIRAA